PFRQPAPPLPVPRWDGSGGRRAVCRWPRKSGRPCPATRSSRSCTGYQPPRGQRSPSGSDHSRTGRQRSRLTHLLAVLLVERLALGRLDDLGERDGLGHVVLLRVLL